jgi:hypothetical protein
MAPRPQYSDAPFLGHIFSPSKHQKPTGLRKTSLVGRTGRNPRRLASFNRMDAVKQEILKQAGMRDSYLRGESTLADAKRSLRPRAISLNVAKPVKPSNRGKTPRFGIRTALDRLVAAHVKRTLHTAGTPVNEHTVDEESVWYDGDDGVLRWGPGQIKYAGRKHSEYERIEHTSSGPITHNPFWYH